MCWLQWQANCWEAGAGAGQTWQCIFGFNNAAIQMQTFPQGRHWDLVPVGKLSSRSRCSYATVLLHKSTKVCATNVPLQRSLRLALSSSLSLCVPICLSACRTMWAVTFFLLLGHPHSVAYCNIAYIRCVRCVFVCMFALVCKPLENCIFISIVYLLRHLFAFDLPCSTRGNCSNHRTTITTAATASWAADKFF